jgi:hypothetical protein
VLHFYQRWITGWEARLASRDTNRVVRPFEWGPDWLDGVSAGGDIRHAVREYVARSIHESGQFFSFREPVDYRLAGAHLTFTSPLPCPYPENNVVHAEFFPVSNHGGCAVLVLPQWNADAASHLGLCRLLNRFGLSALRMSLAYHDRRMPPELERADYHVSSNIGRTIHAARQSVIDARACFSWLARQGYDSLAILGTSLGSCIAFITAAHDARVRTGVFNHVSTYFSDVVWTGLATRHVQEGLQTHVTQDELRDCWSVISPATYLDRMAGRDMPALFIWARYDTTFLPVYSQRLIDSYRARNLPHQVFTLPCGHYTTGQFPFNIMDGLAMCRFLRKSHGK